MHERQSLYCVFTLHWFLLAHRFSTLGLEAYLFNNITKFLTYVYM